MKKPKIWLILTLLPSFLVGVMTLVVILGWLTGTIALTKIIPGFSPMSFNTACSFMFCCASLWFLAFGHKIVSKLFAIAGFSIAALTLLQYLTKHDLHVDLILIQRIVTAGLAGKMPPNTAFAFFCLSISLLLSPSHSGHSWRTITSSLFASMALTMGIVSLLGYLTDVEIAYTWGNNFARMAAHSAVAFVLIGISIIAYDWYQADQQSMWLPIPVFITLFAFSISMTTAIYTQEKFIFQQKFEAAANSAAYLTNQSLRLFTGGLDRMASRWQSFASFSETPWRIDAKNYLASFPYLVALERLDRNLRVQFIEPNNSQLVGQNLNKDPVRIAMIRKTIDSKTPQLSVLLALKQGGLGFLYFVPLYKAHQFTGMLVAVFKGAEFFQTIFNEKLFRSYYVTIMQNETPIFTNLPDRHTKKEYTTASFNYNNIHWVVYLYSKKTFAEQSSDTYLVMLVIGILMSILLSYCTFLILRINRQAAALAESEEKYRLIVDGVRDYAIILLTPRGEIRQWNQGAARLLGYSEQEILGQHVSIFFTENDANNFSKKVLVRTQTEGKLVYDTLLIRKDKSEFWANVLIEPIFDHFKKFIGYVQIIRDITERRKLDLEQKKLISFMEETTDFIGMADLNGKLQYHNRSAKKMIGIPESMDMSSLSIKDMHPPWSYKLLVEKGLPAAYARGTWKGETALLHWDGHEIPVLQTITLLRDDQGRPNSLTTIMRDITDRKALENMLHQQAHFDALTGLANRRLFVERLEVAIEKAQLSHQSICVLLLDLNKFKAVNDTYGHAVGDELLQEVGVRFTKALRPHDLLSRFGGDEFAVLLEEPLEHGKLVAGRIINTLSEPFQLKKYRTILGVSIGITSYWGEYPVNYETLIHHADLAMYQAKKTPLSTLVVYEEMKLGTGEIH